MSPAKIVCPSLLRLNLDYTRNYVVQFVNFSVNTNLIRKYGSPNYTTGNQLFAVCPTLCRVPNNGHSVNVRFAEFQIQDTRQTIDTRHNRTLPSAQRIALGKGDFCRVRRSKHSAKFARARCVRRPLAPTSGRWDFAVCLT